MRPEISSWKWACIASICLLGVAALVIFVMKPGGFEGQGAWFVLLLPGAIPAMVFSDSVYKVAPILEPVIYWMLTISLSYAWYWGISYTTIKIFRSRWKLGSPEF